MWNSLPVDIVDFSSLSRFRRLLCKIDFSEFLTVQWNFKFVLFVIRNLNYGYDLHTICEGDHE